MPIALRALKPMGRTLTQRRRRPAAEPFFTPEEEESALRKIGSMSVGGLSMASAGLDIPGGAIRNILSGRLPSHRPLSWEGRATGRELLEQYGVLGRNRPGFIRKGGQWYDPRDWDWGDIAGFGVEVATDPLTYLTFGGSAVGKAGKALQNAGLWDFVPKAAAKKGLGRMAGRQQLTIKNVLKSMPKDLRRLGAEKVALQAKQMGVPLTQLWKEPLGGGARFWPTGGIIGKAEGIGGRVAARLDPVGEAIRYGQYSPVRGAYAALSKPMRGKMDVPLQKELAAQEAVAQFRIHGIKHRGLIEMGKLEKAGLLTPENIAKHRTAVEWKVPEGMDEVTAAALDPINELTEGIARDSALRIRASAKVMLEDENFAGLGTKALDDVYAAYARRGMTQFDTVLPEIGAAMGRLLRARHPSQLHRWEHYREWKTGSEGINRASTDARLSGTYWRLGGEAIGKNLSRITRNRLEKQYAKGWHITRREAREMVRDQYPTTSPKGVNLDEAVRILREEYGDVLPDDMDTQDLFALAKRLSELDPQHVSTQIPLFGNHPAFDQLNREVFSAQAKTAAEAIYNVAGQSAKHLADMPAGGRMSLNELLTQSGLTGSGAHKQMLARVSKETRDRFQTKTQVVPGPQPKDYFSGAIGPVSDETILSNIYIPQSVADNLVGLGKTLHDPSTIRAVETALGAFWDSWINLFKGHVTAYWPAFVARNFISGQFQNQIGRAYSLNPWAKDGMYSSLRDTGMAMQGKDIPNALDYPLIEALGITDSHEATQHILSALAAGGLGGRHQMEHAGAAAEMVSRNVEELLSTIPGKIRLDTAKRLRRGTWKPTHMRGVGEGLLMTGPKREVSKFFPGVLGEDASLITETLNRFAPALAMMRRGVDPMEAVRRVKLLQVDYTNLGVADKHIRRMIPFAGFIKGMSKFMAEELSQRPGGPLSQTIRAEAAMQREGLPAVIPEHVRQTAAIPLSTTPEGGVNILTSLGFMHEDPLQFLGGVGGQGPVKAGTSMAGTFGREVLSRLAPQVSVPIELATGVSTWQAGPRGGRALVDQYGHLGGFASRIAGRPIKFHPAVEQAPQLLGAGRLTSSLGKLIDKRKSIPQRATNLLTGAHLTTVSPQQQEKVMRDSLEEIMVGMGARQYQRAYFPEWYKEKLSPTQLQGVRNAEAIQKALDKRLRAHRMEAKATP